MKNNGTSTGVSYNYKNSAIADKPRDAFVQIQYGMVDLTS